MFQGKEQRGRLGYNHKIVGKEKRRIMDVRKKINNTLMCVLRRCGETHRTLFDLTHDGHLLFLLLSFLLSRNTTAVSPIYLFQKLLRFCPLLLHPSICLILRLVSWFSLSLSFRRSHTEIENADMCVCVSRIFGQHSDPLPDNVLYFVYLKS